MLWTKRARLLSVSLILAFGLLATQFVSFSWRYQAILLLGLGSYLFSATKNSSTNGEIYLNGTSQQSGVDVRDLLAYTNTNRLFSRYAISTFANFISGQWNEVVIYPTDQSSNRAAIETNINNFYSIYP